jgi:hypothetical protein
MPDEPRTPQDGFDAGRREGYAAALVAVRREIRSLIRRYGDTMIADTFARELLARLDALEKQHGGGT